MTSAIETLVLQIEATATDSGASYKQLQSLLKQARDQHSVQLQCALNKSMIVLKQECQRIATAFRDGTLEQKTTAKKQAKPTAAKATTHTSDKAEPATKASEPKQVAINQQLAEAQQEIERLRRELADKTNELAEYAEALEHARETISSQNIMLQYAQRDIQELQEVANAAVANAEAVEVTEIQEPEVTEVIVQEQQDAVDSLLIDSLITLVNRKYGSKKGAKLSQALANPVTHEQLMQLLKDCAINSDILEQAETLVK